MAKDKSSTKISNIWTKMSNPLQYLNSSQIENMLSQSRYGDDIRLQVAYQEIEKNTPIFSACINKRIAGVQGRSWDIVPDNDSEEAKLQAQNVKKMFKLSDTQVEDNLTDAIRHLTLGTFRGRSAVKPFISDDGRLFFKKLDNWNFLRVNNKNFWNPKIEHTLKYDSENLTIEGDGIVEIPKDEICYVLDDKPLDWIGITIYLRQLVGEETWARFIEKQGIPQVIITTPDGTPETDLQKWNYRAQTIYEGGSGALPSGTKIDELNTSRSQDPFTNYITHQSEMFCILAVGGTLDVLAGTQGSSGTGMGSSTSDNQMSQFQSLVSYDCKRIQNAMQVAVQKAVKYIFNTNNILCHFEYVEKDDTKPSEYLELAQKCRDLGLKIDISKLKELTGLQFISDDVDSVWTPVNDKEIEDITPQN